MADLNALIAQGAQFNLPNPVDQYSKMLQLQQMGQSNQLNRLKMDEYTRGIAEQNAMRDVMSQPGFDVYKPEHQALLLRAAPNTAPALMEKLAQVQKEKAQTEHFGAQSGKLNYEVESQKLTQGLNEISNMPDINAAYASIDSHVADKSISAEKAAQLKAQIKAAPDFQTWQKQTVTGMLAAKDRLDAMANQRFLNPPSAATAPAAPQAFVTKDSSGRARYIVNGVEVSPEDYQAAQAGVVAQPVRSFGAPESTTVAPPVAQPDATNALALKIQGLEAQRNKLRPNLDAPIAMKQYEALGKQIEDLSKGFSVAPGAAHVVPGVGTFERAPTPSEFEQLLTNSGLTEQQKNAARAARVTKESTHQPPTQISLTQNAEKSYGAAFGGKIADLDVAKYDAATKAPDLAANANRVLTSLNDGNVFVGPAATVKLNLARVLNAAGASNDEKIANTETLISNLGRNTLGMVKSSGLGTGQGFTDKDLQFLEKVAGGSIDYNVQTLRNLAELSHKAAEASANTWNKRAKEIPASATIGTGISAEPIVVPARAAKAAAATKPAGVPADWVLHTDAAGKKAYVSPDGKSFKEVP